MKKGCTRFRSCRALNSHPPRPKVTTDPLCPRSVYQRNYQLDRSAEAGHTQGWENRYREKEYGRTLPEPETAGLEP